MSSNTQQKHEGSKLSSPVLSVVKKATKEDPPTWYGTVRGMFTRKDITCMAAHNIFLDDYESVKRYSSDIYQQTSEKNMPLDEEKWSDAKCQTFYDWIQAGFPKGQPASTDSLGAALIQPIGNTRLRKDVTTLTQQEIDTLKKAFLGIMNLDPSEPNSYFVQAGYHWLPAPNSYCMHHVPGFLPWHRVYLVSFENALRAVPGCQDVTLPYWDFSKDLPKVLQEAPFDKYIFQADVGSPDYQKGSSTKRNSVAVISQQMKALGVIECVNRALQSTDWEDFHGWWTKDAKNNTFISAHDSGHNSIGKTMEDQDVAAFDPVFWFFHSNLDRVYWQWQRKMKATNLNGLLSTINDKVSRQIFTESALGGLPPWDGQLPLKVTCPQTINSLDLTSDVSVDYQDPPGAAITNNFLLKVRRNVLASEKFEIHPELVNVRVDHVNRLKVPGSFNVHLLKDGNILASSGFFQPNEAAKCPSCVSNAYAHFDFDLPLETVTGGTLSVQVEPLNKAPFGDRIPFKLMENPTITIRLPIATEKRGKPLLTQ